MADILLVCLEEDVECALQVRNVLQQHSHLVTFAELSGEPENLSIYDFVVWVCSPASFQAPELEPLLDRVRQGEKKGRRIKQLLVVLTGTTLPTEAEWRTARWVKSQRVLLRDELDSLLRHIGGPASDGFMEDLALEEDHAPQATAPVAASLPAKQKTTEVLAGKIVHRIPKRMRKDVPEHVEVRVGTDEAKGLSYGLIGRGKLVTEDLSVVESMTVELVTPTGAFDVEAQSPSTQLVASEVLSGADLQKRDYGRWSWRITPRHAGTHTLVVKVAAMVMDSRSVPAATLLPDRFFEVKVSVNYGIVGIRFAKWAVSGFAGAVVAALIGAATTKLWWPMLKAWIDSF